jgi:hypothetical protein
MRYSQSHERLKTGNQSSWTICTNCLYEKRKRGWYATTTKDEKYDNIIIDPFGCDDGHRACPCGVDFHMAYALNLNCTPFFFKEIQISSVSLSTKFVELIKK